MTSFFLKASRKKIAVFLMCTTFLIAAPRPAHAWNYIIVPIIQRALDSLWENLQAMLLGAGKRLAVELAVRQANKLTGNGNRNSPTFISDYKAYIYSATLDESLTFANTLLTQTLGGKYSGLVYTAASGNLRSLGQNYMTYLAEEARGGLIEGSGVCKYTLDQYSTNPILSLGKGDWRVFNAMNANACNNPAGFTMQTRVLFAEDLARRTEAAKARAIAGQGFLGVEKNGIITAPGAIIRDITSKSQTMAFDLIPQSKFIGELLSSAAGAFVNTLMNNLVQNGFESVSKKVNRELGKVDKKVLDARRDIESQLGPGAPFFRNFVQQAGNAGTRAYNSQINEARSKVNMGSVNCTVDQGC